MAVSVAGSAAKQARQTMCRVQIYMESQLGPTWPFILDVRHNTDLQS